MLNAACKEKNAITYDTCRPKYFFSCILANMLVYQILFKYILNVSKLRHRNSYNINVALFSKETLFNGCSRASERCNTHIYIYMYFGCGNIIITFWIHKMYVFILLNQ